MAAPADADAPTQRIDTAVDKFCARPDIRNLKGMAGWEECGSAALAVAMEQLSLVAPYAGLALASRF